jgi:hypothetical protein
MQDAYYLMHYMMCELLVQCVSYDASRFDQLSSTRNLLVPSPRSHPFPGKEYFKASGASCDVLPSLHVSTVNALQETPLPSYRVRRVQEEM